MVRNIRGGSPRNGGQGIEEEIAHIRGLIPMEAEERGIKTEVEVKRDDDVAGAICQAAECANADVVCLGQHPVGKRSRSIAHEVFERCPRPVLVVKPPVP